MFSAVSVLLTVVPSTSLFRVLLGTFWARTGRPVSIRTRGIPTDLGTLKDRVIEDRITE
jgi:hypothetical protein